MPDFFGQTQVWNNYFPDLLKNAYLNLKLTIIMLDIQKMSNIFAISK